MFERLAITPRLAIALTFFALGAGFGAWAGAAPAIMAAAGLSKEAWGSGIVAFTAAYVLVMYLASNLASAVSGRAMLLGTIPLQAMATALFLTADSLPVFFAAMALFGAVTGIVDVFMNAEAAAIEHERKRPLLASFHAMASAGIAVMALAASFLATLHGTGAVAAAMAVLFGLAWLAVFATVVPRRSAPRSAHAGAARPVTMLVLLGAIAGISIAGETAAIMWSAKLLDEQAPALAAVAGAGACFYGACHATMRFCGDAIRRRFGDPQAIAASLALTALAFLIVALSPAFTLSLAGFALVGIGSAMIVPCTFALAAALEPHDRAGAIGFVSLVTALPRIALPWVFGIAAEHASLGAAFGLAAAAILVGLLPAALLARARPQAA